MVHHQWLAAPDMIWHIHSHLYCSSRDGGRDLLSSVKAVPTMGQVPCEFQADWPTFIFQPVAPDVIWHIYLHLCCSSKDVGRDLLSCCDLAHLLAPVLNAGQSARNSQGTFPMVGAASPEDSKFLPPSFKEQYRCE